VRLLLPLVLVAAVVGLIPAHASAKDQVHARLLKPLPRDAEPGSKLRIAWSLKDARGRPFSAGGLFVRLVGGRGSQAEAEVDGRGVFVADVVVPDGGIKSVEFGLRGWRQMGRGGSWESADAVFPLRGAVFAADRRQGAGRGCYWV
jgi:hypothetical protein